MIEQIKMENKEQDLNESIINESKNNRLKKYIISWEVVRFVEAENEEEAERIAVELQEDLEVEELQINILEVD